MLLPWLDWLPRNLDQGENLEKWALPQSGSSLMVQALADMTALALLAPKHQHFIGLQEARSFLPVPHLPKPLQQHEVYVTVSREFQLVQNRKTFAPRTKSLTAKSPPKIPLYSTMKFIYQVTNPHSSVKSLGFRSATNSNHALRYCQQQ